jgi:small-conductance mechanosensitive channel
MRVLRTTVEVVYGLGDAFVGIEYALIMAGMLTGGFIAWYMLMWLFEYLLLYRERQTPLILAHKTRESKIWMRRPWRSCGSIKHLVVQTVFFAGLVIIVWIAAASAGFNPWTSAAASLGLSIVGTYVFATPLGLLGAGYFVHLTNAISVGEYYEFYGMGPAWEGRIVAIYSMWVEMARYDPDSGGSEVIYIPISTFLSTPRKRNWIKELEAKPVCRTDPLSTPTSKGSANLKSHIV